MFARIILWVFLAIYALWPGTARADCVTPAGRAGTMDYFGAPDNTFKFCNGTVWVDMDAGAAAQAGGWYRALKVEAATNTRVDVTADMIVLEDTGSGLVHRVTNLSASANLNSTGIGGRDGGTESANTWYYVWVISNGATPALLLSPSATAPTMPGGYSYKVRVGAVRNNSFSNLWRTIQYGNRVQVKDYANGDGSGELYRGDSNDTVITRTATNYIPPTAHVIDVFLEPGDDAWVMVGPQASLDEGAYRRTCCLRTDRGLMTVEDGNIYIATDEDIGSVWVSGWIDNL